MSKLNNNTIPGKSSGFDFSYAYAGVSSGGMLANIFILAVLISDRKYLKQSAIITGIAVSHLLCSTAIGAAGLYRLIYVDTLNDRTLAWSCVLRIYPLANPLAFQSMGVMLIVVGLERFCVFTFPNWYRMWWSNKKCWQLVLLAYMIVIVSLCVGLYIVWHQPMVTKSCDYSGMYGKSYYLYNGVVAASGGTIAVVLTLIGLIKGMRQAKRLPLGEIVKMKRQLKLTRSMLSVAACDFCLVVIPNFLFVLSIIDPLIFSSSGGGLSTYTNVAYCVNTVMTVWLYLAFNRSFRKAAFRLMRCQRSQVQSTTAVFPLTHRETQPITTMAW